MSSTPEEPPPKLLDNLVTALVQGYIVAIVVLVLLCVVVCTCYFVLKRRRQKRKLNKPVDALEAGLNSGPRNEIQPPDVVKKRWPVLESSYKCRRTQAETGSIIDMLDTVEWLRKTLKEGGMNTNDENMQEVKALLRKLRQFKHTYPSEDELDYDLTPLMPITPSRTTFPELDFPPVDPSKPKEFDDRKMAEILEIKKSVQGLADKVTSLRQSFRLKDNEKIRKSIIQRNPQHSIPYSRQASSFSSSSLVCYEPSPVSDTCFELPVPTSQTAPIYSGPKSAPTPPKRVDSFKRATLSNKGKQDDKPKSPKENNAQGISVKPTGQSGLEDSSTCPSPASDGDRKPQTTPTGGSNPTTSEFDDLINELLEWGASNDIVS